MEFSKVIVGTAECTNRLTMYTKECGQMISNDISFYESQFSRAKIAEKEMAEGVDFLGLVKTIHKGFYGYI